MAINQGLTPNMPGRLLGFKNLFKKESREWWRSRRWWLHLLIWVVIIDGLLIATLFGLKNIAAMAGENITDADLFLNGLQTLFGVASMGITFGTIIITQDELIGEKQNGTAAWMLSKPASRTSFYLSKLLANLIPISILMIILPMGIAYGIFLLQGYTVELYGYLIAVGLLFVHTLFYLTLSLLMGVFLSKRAGLLAVTLGCFIGGQVLPGFIKELVYAGPFVLPQAMPAIALQGPSVLPTELWISLAVSMAWCVVFVGLALWKIQRLEF